MREFINILNESKSVDTKTKDDTKFGFMSDLESGSKAVSKPKTSSSVAGMKKAGGAKTRRAASTATMNHPGASAALSDMLANAGEDEISDAEAARNAGIDMDLGERPVPPTNENLPTIVNKEISIDGGHGPEWHQIKHLPGYMLNAIRAGGRQVFRQFTNTPIEDIQMVCTIAGMNPESEVKAVMNWLRANGVREDSVKMTFGGGVEADVRLWKTKDYSFLCVKDFMGIYVYAWVNLSRPPQIDVDF